MKGRDSRRIGWVLEALLCGAWVLAGCRTAPSSGGSNDVRFVSATTPRSSDLAERLRAALHEIASSDALIGATAAVSIGGQVTAVATGLADRERGIAMTPGHRMLVGSAGKPMFAFVALSLAAEGALDLDAPVSRWLGSEPWFARLPNASQLTMRHLLSHRGGIPNHVADSSFIAAVRAASPGKRQLGFTPQEQISFVLDRPAPFPAGEGFQYTDTGYLVAGLALERAAGRSFYAELESRVLGPLDLRATSPSVRSDLPGIPQGYLLPTSSPGPRGYSAWGLPETMVSGGKLALNPVYEWTGGGMVSTAADLARWMETLFEQSPWKAIGAAMVGGRVPAATYGLGIFVRDGRHGTLYGHPGGFPGYRTEVAYSPDLGVGVAFQTNRERADGPAALHLILEAVRAALR